MGNAIRLIALTITAVLKARLTLVVFCLLFGASAWAQGLQDGEKRSSEVFTITDLGPNLEPAGINARGQVAATGNCPTCGPNQQALLWSATTGLKDLGGSTNNFLGGSAAFGLNDLGELVGTSNRPFSPVPCCDAFLWSSSGEIQDLGTLPGCAATGIGINDRGEVAGVSEPDTLPGNASGGSQDHGLFAHRLTMFSPGITSLAAPPLLKITIAPQSALCTASALEARGCSKRLR